MVDDLSLRKDDMVAVVTWVVVAMIVGKVVDGLWMDDEDGRRVAGRSLNFDADEFYPADR